MEYGYDELYHYGILGMKWGVRRYQDKKGRLTPLGKQHLAANNIRTEENLVEKTIPKGTKVYRTTASIKDGNSKSTYVSRLDVDRNLYKEGSLVKKYAGVSAKDKSVYEKEFELKTDIHVPSLKTVREIEKQIVSDVKKRDEVAKAYVESFLMIDQYCTTKDLRVMREIANKMDKCNTLDQKRSLYDETCKKYGDWKGDDYYQRAKNIQDAKDYIDTNDSLIVEQSLGRATNVKNDIIKELKKRGYNAMYDNASIGVRADGQYSKYQEGIEPLIIFDSDSSLCKTATREITKSEQLRSGDQYDQWKKERDELLRKFK